MGDGSLWVGKDEAEGIPVEPRRDVQPPPHWRLEAVAATERPRSLAVSDDRRSAVFIQDRDTSDVWLLAHGDPTPRRLTTGRDPMPYWEDTQPRISPDGSRVAYGDAGHVWIVPTAGGTLGLEWPDGDITPLTPLPGGGFRLGRDPDSPERAAFEAEVEGRPMRVVVSGWPFDRVD